jgi:hypothetical protein
MTVAKKDQDRVGYAWMYGAQGPQGWKRAIGAPYWEEYAEAWLQGFDGHPIDGPTRPVSDQLEAELDDVAISGPNGQET